MWGVGVPRHRTVLAENCIRRGSGHPGRFLPMADGPGGSLDGCWPAGQVVLARGSAWASLAPHAAHRGELRGKVRHHPGSPLRLLSPTQTPCTHSHSPRKHPPFTPVHHASQEVLLASGEGPFPQDLPDGPAWRSIFPFEQLRGSSRQRDNQADQSNTT